MSNTLTGFITDLKYMNVNGIVDTTDGPVFRMLHPQLGSYEDISMDMKATECLTCVHVIVI